MGSEKPKEPERAQAKKSLYINTTQHLSSTCSPPLSFYFSSLPPVPSSSLIFSFRATCLQLARGQPVLALCVFFYMHVFLEPSLHFFIERLIHIIEWIGELSHYNIFWRTLLTDTHWHWLCVQTKEVNVCRCFSVTNFLQNMCLWMMTEISFWDELSL